MADAASARIDPADRGLLLGDGVFETLRVKSGRIMHFARHAARLRGGAAALAIPLRWSDDQLHAGASAIAAPVDGVVRITLTRGPGPRGLAAADPSPSVLMSWSPGLPDAAPCRAILATCTRRNEHSPLARIKSLNYLDSILARQEAATLGAGDAILRNTAGNLAEAAAGNLFLSLDGAWFTPPIADGALPGIARALILQAGLAHERTMTPACLSAAQAGFVSSSLALRPLSGVDGITFGSADLHRFRQAVLF